MSKVEKSEVKQYYELRRKAGDSVENRKRYFRFLKKLSGQTTSREFFTLENGLFDPERKQLHNNIVEEYLSAYKAQSVPRLYFILGSIGSGKTSLRDAVVKRFKSNDLLYINFDYLKLKLPEYEILKKLNPKKAAHFVQSESAKLVGLLYKKAVQKRVNIIFEKNLRIGQNDKLHIVEEIKKSFKKQYIVSIHIVFLDSPQTAWKRVQLRYKKIKRYVPKTEVFSTFKNLFPNLNKLLNIQFKDNAPIKIWIWYNGPLEPESEKKAHLIGLICFSGPQKALNRLYNQFNANNTVISDKTVDSFVVFIHHRWSCLPTLVSRNLLQMDCLKKLKHF